MKAAASVSRASDQIFLSTTNVIERASAAAYRSLERLEARAALAGKTGSDKLTTQFEQDERQVWRRRGRDKPLHPGDE
jgi:hypothetical protein